MRSCALPEGSRENAGGGADQTERKAEVGAEMKGKKLLGAALCLLLAAGLAALVLLRLARGTAGSARAALRVEEAEDGSLRVMAGELFCPDVSGIVRDHASGKWWLAENGLVRRDYTGFAESGGETWYVDGGLVDFGKNGLVDAPADSGASQWYVLGGRAMTDFSGLTRSLRDCPAIMLQNGEPDYSFTGLAQNDDGWWYVFRGRVDTKRTGLARGRVNGQDAEWLVFNGRVQLGWSGYVSYGENALLLIASGHTEPAYTGILPDGRRFRYVEEGRVDVSARRNLTLDDARWVLMDGYAWPVTTDRARMLYDAMALLPSIINENMTKEEKLRACFDYIKGLTEGVSRSPHDTSMAWPEVYAADIFEGTGGNCFSFAAAFAYLVRAAGYTEVYACNSGGHGWADVDGLIYDPERAANSYLNPCFGLDYQYVPDYRQTLETSTVEGYEWMRIKIFDVDREES